MKVVIVNKFHYIKGGSERYYFTIAEAFKKLNDEVHFFSMLDEKNIKCDDEKYFVSNKGPDSSLKGKIKFIRTMFYSKEAYNKMTLLLKDVNPDVVILNLVHKHLTLSIVKAVKDFNKNIKIVWVMHDLITICPSYTMLDNNLKVCEKCILGDFKNCYKNKCIRSSFFLSYLSYLEAKKIRKKNYYNLIDLYVTPSNFYKKKLEESKFSTSKIIQLTNPLPLDTKYEINKKSKDYLLYFGRLSKEKGILNLLDVMKDIDYKLIILGEGPLKDTIKNYIKNDKLNNVTIEGFKEGEELRDYIRYSKAVIIPSIWYENAPYTLSETLSLGKIAIVSNNGGIKEFILDKVNGFIFKDKNELKKYILDLINLTDIEYEKMSKEAYNYAIDNFNALNYVLKLKEYIKEI